MDKPETRPTLRKGIRKSPKRQPAERTVSQCEDRWYEKRTHQGISLFLFFGFPLLRLPFFLWLPVKSELTVGTIEQQTPLIGNR